MPQFTTPKCPKCGIYMLERSGKFGKFYGCSKYPDCRGTMDAKNFTPEELPESEWKSKINTLLQTRTHPDTYAYWCQIKGTLPDCWERSTSSSGKYHQRRDGSVPSIGEHTYEMLLAATKIGKLFGDKMMNPEMDALFLAIATHDVFKYGRDNDRAHTTSDHDKLIGDWVCSDGLVIPKSVNKELWEKAVRFHLGRWSTDGKMEVPNTDEHVFHVFLGCLGDG